MADEGLIIGVDFNTAKAEAKMKRLKAQYDAQKNTIKEIGNEIEKTTDYIDGLELKIKSTNRYIEYLNQKLSESKLSGNIVEQETFNRKILKATEQVEKLQIELSKEKKTLSEQNIELYKQEEKLYSIGSEITSNNKKQNKFTKAFEKSQKSADRFGKRLKSLIASALFFSVVTKAFTALRNEFGKLITETGTKTASLVAQLNGSLAVLGRTLYESARPYIEWILQALVKMVNILTQGLAKILGKNVNEMKKLAQQTKKTGEEAKKATAGFDTLQTIDTSSGSSGSDSGVGTDFSALNDGISNEIAVLMTILSGALLVLGVILTFTGVNIPLGLGLIAAGALGMAATISASWNTMPQKTKDTITGIMAIGGALFILLGLVLILTGVGIPLGIGLILLGASSIAGAVALSPGDTFVEKIRNLWQNVKRITKEFINWFSDKVLDGIFGESVGDALKKMFDSFCYLWEDIIDFFGAVIDGDWKRAGKAFVNVLIDVLNILIQGITMPFKMMVGGVSKLTGVIGKLFDKNWEFDTSWTKVPQIPRLATGAVLPGGSPMLAWVNDQPKGQPYLEGSIDNIAAAFEKYLGSNPSRQNISINFTGSLAQLARVLAPEISTENNRASVFSKG